MGATHKRKRTAELTERIKRLFIQVHEEVSLSVRQEIAVRCFECNQRKRNPVVHESLQKRNGKAVMATAILFL